MSEIYISLLSFSFGALAIYLTAYMKEKGKNRALREDILKLEGDKQAIVAKFNSELEILKKSHSLDIEKRKYKYEEKRKQFTKYFSMLDEFNNKSNMVIAEKFFPIVEELWGNIFNNKGDKKDNMLIFTKKMHVLIHELYQEQLKLTQETNSIRLVSSPEVDTLLNELEKLIASSTEAGSEMMEFMITPEYAADQSLLIPYQEKVNSIGVRVQECREKIRFRMKVELDEI